MNEYDFIVVGAGPSGCVVASRLAHSPAKPLVLLLEAGGANNSLSESSSEERFNLAFQPKSPYNWNYKTTPQHQLAGQAVDYSRGKGLGGSTAINFCGWTVGPRDDFDEYARLVEDDRFGWENVRKCLRRIETLHTEIPDESLRNYVDAKLEEHGTSGMVDLTYGDAWLPDVGDIFVAAAQSNLPLQKDINAGNPIGMGMGTVSIHSGRRLTAASTYLQHAPSNLSIVTGNLISRVLFDGDRAIGVVTSDGREYRASREVILSGGAINTPQTLLLSGIGPEDELKRHGIRPIRHLQMVGRNLQDHCFSAVGVSLKKNISSGNASQSPSPMGWFKLPKLDNTVVCNQLPNRVRDHRLRATVPDFEIATHTPPSFVGHEVHPQTDFLGAICLLMNPQSSGTIRLQSTDPREAPLIDANFLNHPYDRRVMIQGMRHTKRLLSAPVYASRTVKTYFPPDDSEEAIWEHIRNNIWSSWHMSGTVKMGTGTTDACVDSHFRVFGLRSLRVVDMSVVPFVPSCHTQSTAYILGEIASDVLIEEHGLDIVK